MILHQVQILFRPISMMCRFKIKYWERVMKYCLILPLLLILPACSCYQWGSPGLDSLPFQTLYVKPIMNKTYIPEAQALVSQQLIRYLQQSGIWITQCEEDADAVLTVVLRNYNQTTLTTQRHDTTLASSFSVSVDAECTLINNRDCSAYFANRRVCASINAEADDSVLQVLYQDMPILTEKLADQIRNLVIGTW